MSCGAVRPSARREAGGRSGGGRPHADSTGIFIRGQKRRGETGVRWRREGPPERLASACDTARLGDP
eukprot:7172119-Prymnesium_polylepis.1